MAKKRTTTKSVTDNQFFDQYKDPRWQEKRLSIMQSDGFRCRRCHSKDKELHVHHLKYKKNSKPWEYPNSNLVTLCESCHEEFHALKTELNFNVDKFLEIWITNKSKDQFDAESLRNFFYDVLWVKEETRVRFSKLISDITAFAHFNQETVQ